MNKRELDLIRELVNHVYDLDPHLEKCVDPYCNNNSCMVVNNINRIRYSMKYTGLVWRKRRFYHGVNHGYLIGWPPWIKILITNVVNYVMCAILGHDSVMTLPPHSHTVCTSCSKKWRK